MIITLSRELFRQSPQTTQAVGPQLTQDAREHLGELPCLSVAGDGKGVSRQRGLNLGVVEVDDHPIVLYHVHLGKEKG